MESGPPQGVERRAEGRRRAPIRVLVVDDSALIRKSFERMLADEEDIEIVASAKDPYDAREKLVEFTPDVMLLDVEMPRMDGLTFLGKVMQHRPMPVIIVSSIAEEGGRVAMRAYELGAVEVICKPTASVGLNEVKTRVIDAIRAARRSKMAAVKPAIDAVKPALRSRSKRPSSAYKRSVIAIGASTGGTEATNKVLASFGPNDPGILIIQHMGAHFMAAYAERLNANHEIEVRIARDGDKIESGVALMAPGDKHMTVQKRGSGYLVRIIDGEKVHHQRPAVDITFNALARVAGSDAVGMLLTGMGRDGAEGLLAMKKAGALTVAQDQETCVVYGMPRVANELGAVDEVCALTEIGEQALRFATRR